MIDIIIVGAGPAGLTAALYGARSGKKVLVLESNNYGGQILNASLIENFPSIDNISGFDFSTNLYEQAKNSGAIIKFEKVEKIEDGKIKKVITNKETYETKSIILATGAENKMLELENEKKFIGSGISYCATCDGPLYKKQIVAIVGGGNTAISDAEFLSEYCEKVYLIHRRNNFRAEDSEIEELKQKNNVELILDTTVEKLIGNNKLEKINILNRNTNETKELEVSALFIAIGQKPSNIEFINVVDIDDKGYIIADENCQTKTKGIFVAGDSRTKTVRQLTTAVADGTISALTACVYINNLNK